MPRKTKPNTMRSSLRGEFSAAARLRGKLIMENGNVRDLEQHGTGVWAHVHGTAIYEVGLRWTNVGIYDAVEVSCTCPAYEKHGPCKHLWALVLELEKRAFSPEAGISRNTIVTDFLESHVSVEPEHSKFKGLGPDLDFFSGFQSDWQQALRDFRANTPRWKNLWSAVENPTWELRYVVDSYRTGLYGDLRLNLKIFQRLKNGNWGRGKTYIAGNHGMPELELSADKVILAKLTGANTGGFSFASSYDGYRIPPELCADLLPEIAHTGRLFLDLRNEKEHVPVIFDEGLAWEFQSRLATDKAADKVFVRGEFKRGNEVLDATEPDLVLQSGLFINRGILSRFTPLEAEGQIDLIRSGRLSAPLEAREQVLEILASAPGFKPSEEAHTLRDTPPSFHVHVRASEEVAHRSRNLECLVFAVYEGQRVNVFQGGDFALMDDGQVIQRDLDLEADALQCFVRHGGKRISGQDPESGGCAVVTGHLSKFVMGLLAAGWSVDADGRVWRRAGASSFSVRSGIDWFDLEGGIDFGGGQVASLPSLIAATKSGAKTVQLGDGTVGVLPERWMESWGLLNLAGKPEGDALRFAKNQGWLLDALLAERGEVAFDADFKKLKKRIANFDGLTPKNEPKSFKGSLREYQRTGLSWFQFLRNFGINGCLADDMGLGKTIQVLAMFEARRLNRRRKGGVDLPSLVVAPRSVVFNWVDEALRFTPKLRVLEYTGTNRQELLAQADGEGVDLIVTTYGTLRRDILELCERDFDYVVLDEAQAIKNPGSQAAKAARLLRSRHRLALSGTPIENHLGELWSLFEFLNPGMLGASRAFQRFSRTDSESDQENFSRLAQALAPFFLRRTKEEVLKDLPEKTEQVLHCELEGQERVEYDKLRDFYRTSLAGREEEVGLSKMKIQVLEALLRLRQAACHPGLIDKSRVGEDSAKLRVLLPMLEEICNEGHKALIFSQFTSLLAIVRKHLDERGITYEYLDGRTRKRKEKVDRFQADDDCPLFLISIKAGGSGLNLTKADYVFLLDPWWNPAVEAQAIDRVHRIGRTKPVIAYRLIAAETVEQKVVELQESKRKLADAILGQGSVGLRDMTSADLELLLS